MKAREIRELTAEEMQRKAADLRQELFNLRFQHAVGQLENRSRIKQTKRDIARLLTVIGEKAATSQSANS
jgi:large subunit ribosomal protein L29